MMDSCYRGRTLIQGSGGWLKRVRNWRPGWTPSVLPACGALGSIGGMPTEIRHRWRFWDSARKQWCVTRYHASEADMRERHPDAEPMPGTEQEFVVTDGTAFVDPAHVYSRRWDE